MLTLIRRTSSKERQEQLSGTASKFCCQKLSSVKIINVIVSWLVQKQASLVEQEKSKQLRKSQISIFTFLNARISK